MATRNRERHQSECDAAANPFVAVKYFKIDLLTFYFESKWIGFGWASRRRTERRCDNRTFYFILFSWIMIAFYFPLVFLCLFSLSLSLNLSTIFVGRTTPYCVQMPNVSLANTFDYHRRTHFWHLPVSPDFFFLFIFLVVTLNDLFCRRETTSNIVGINSFSWFMERNGKTRNQRFPFGLRRVSRFGSIKTWFHFTLRTSSVIEWVSIN